MSRDWWCTHSKARDFPRAYLPSDTGSGRKHRPRAMASTPNFGILWRISQFSARFRTLRAANAFTVPTIMLENECMQFRLHRDIGSFPLAFKNPGRIPPGHWLVQPRAPPINLGTAAMSAAATAATSGRLNPVVRHMYKSLMVCFLLLGVGIFETAMTSCSLEFMICSHLRSWPSNRSAKPNHMASCAPW